MECCGIAAAPGYGMGNVFLLQDQQIEVVKRKLSQDEVESELAHLEEILHEAIGEIEEIQEHANKNIGDAADVFTAHIMLLQDPEYVGEIRKKIIEECVNAEAAVEEVTKKFLDLFDAIDDEYIRGRAADLKDVSHRLLRHLLGIKALSWHGFTGNAIICARDLTPSDTAQLDHNKVKGFVTNVGGRTSHSAIMARSLGIPAVVGARDILEKVTDGDFIIVDGYEGKVFVNPPNSFIQKYKEKQEKVKVRQQKFKKLAQEPSITKDGIQVNIVANIGNPQDGCRAIASGAEGIGLYRTEFLYMGRSELPSEREQFAAYKEVAAMFGKSRPVVIRTLDIGGDKELPYMSLPKEMNPFLGYRAIRLCLDRIELFKIQLRAILRASAYGNIKIMYPMIATLQELQAANQVLNEVKQELIHQKIEFNTEIEVGIMVEIPAVAVLADEFAKEVDFFSIGTNDLVQYTLAVDRLNEKIAYLYQPLNPAVLRLVRNVITAAHCQGKKVGMCGELAGDLTAIPLLLGLGLDEFSMSTSSILPARALIQSLTVKKAQQLVQAAFKITSAEKIKKFVEQEVPVIARLR